MLICFIFLEKNVRWYFNETFSYLVKRQYNFFLCQVDCVMCVISDCNHWDEGEQLRSRSSPGKTELNHASDLLHHNSINISLDGKQVGEMGV